MEVNGLVISSIDQLLFRHGGLCETLSQNLAARWFNEQTFVLCPVSLHFFGTCGQMLQEPTLFPASDEANAMS